MRFLAKAIGVAAILVALLLAPALMAPHVPDSPVRWAYRMYHPFMYRYPLRFIGVARDAESSLPGMPPLDQSYFVAHLMIEHW